LADFARRRPDADATPSERPPLQWLSCVKLQAAIDVLWPRGVTVEIKPAGEHIHPDGSIGVRLARGSQQASVAMNAARQIKLTPSRRSCIARHAVKER
jgi:hypothetical protein